MNKLKLIFFIFFFIPLINATVDYKTNFQSCVNYPETADSDLDCTYADDNLWDNLIDAGVVFSSAGYENVWVEFNITLNPALTLDNSFLTNFQIASCSELISVSPQKVNLTLYNSKTDVFYNYGTVWDNTANMNTCNNPASCLANAVYTTPYSFYLDAEIDLIMVKVQIKNCSFAPSDPRMDIAEINLTYAGALPSNKLPDVNITNDENFGCIQEFGDNYNFAFNYSVYDEEGDTIWYSTSKFNDLKQTFLYNERFRTVNQYGDCIPSISAFDNHLITNNSYTFFYGTGYLFYDHIVLTSVIDDECYGVLHNYYKTGLNPIQDFLLSADIQSNKNIELDLGLKFPTDNTNLTLTFVDQNLINIYNVTINKLNSSVIYILANNVIIGNFTDATNILFRIETNRTGNKILTSFYSFEENKEIQYLKSTSFNSFKYLSFHLEADNWNDEFWIGNFYSTPISIFEIEDYTLFNWTLTPPAKTYSTNETGFSYYQISFTDSYHKALNEYVSKDLSFFLSLQENCKGLLTNTSFVAPVTDIWNNYFDISGLRDELNNLWYLFVLVVFLLLIFIFRDVTLTLIFTGLVTFLVAFLFGNPITHLVTSIIITSLGLTPFFVRIWT